MEPLKLTRTIPKLLYGTLVAYSIGLTCMSGQWLIKQLTLAGSENVASGSQVEESYISADELCRVVRQDPDTVLRTELLLLQVLSHHKAKHHLQ